MSPAVVGLMPVNRGGVGSEAGDKQSGEGVGPPKRNKCVVCADKPFECNICRYRFEFKGHMLRHKANNHPDELAAEEADADELPANDAAELPRHDGGYCLTSLEPGVGAGGQL
ncbi:hypothetical protein quinque_014824 [Culex quinquefasciatus]